jgi:integrase
MRAKSTKGSGGHWESTEVRGLRIWRDANGRPSYHIRKALAGKRYELATGATNIESAIEQLRRFEADPERYDPRGDSREPLFLSEKLVEEFLEFSLGEGNSAPWRRKQKNLLAWWADRLEGIDLRRVSLHDHVLPAMKRRDATAKHHRVAVLKFFFTWLRTEVHRVTTAEDPVFGQLQVPQTRAAQLTRSKVVPRDHVLLAIEQLRAEQRRREAGREAREEPRRSKGEGSVLQLVRPSELAKGQGDGPWADALTVQAGTGWHTTEIQRFAADGMIEPLPRHVQQEGVAGVVVCPMRKSGEPQRTRVGPEVLEAAKRLRAHGAFSREWYDRAVRAACDLVKRPDGETGIPVFTPGKLRHSVATWAIEAGADPAQVAAFLGHRSPRTTRKFYATHASPAKVPTLA